MAIQETSFSGIEKVVVFFIACRSKHNPCTPVNGKNISRVMDMALCEVLLTIVIFSFSCPVVLTLNSRSGRLDQKFENCLKV